MARRKTAVSVNDSFLKQKAFIIVEGNCAIRWVLGEGSA